jgi:sensor histidine kinase YesM
MMNVNRHHIYYWLVYYSFVFILDYIAYGPLLRVDRELLVFFNQLCVFYSFLFALVHFKKGSFWNWFKSIGRFLLSFGLITFLNYLRSRLAAHYGINLHDSLSVFLTETAAIYMQLAFYALGYYYLTRYSTKQKELRQLAEAKAAQDVAAAQLITQNAQLRQDVLELENNFLRAQINPHFLYNTLNMFYAQALPNNKVLADGIVTLAKIMRYSLEATENRELAPLQMEVAQLERVINMHRLRFGSQLSIEFTKEGQYEMVKVAPLVFVTLLENALKHGEARDAAHPIALWLCVDAKRIYFTIRNKKGYRPADDSHGIGLLNIKKRLASVYDNHYQLDVEETAEQYHVALVIEYGEEVSVESGELRVES